MAAYLPPNLRTDAFFITRSSKRPGIWKMPLQGGEEERVLDRAGGDDWFNWALARNGIYFRDAQKSKNDDHVGLLDFFDFATGKTTTVSTSDQPRGMWDWLYQPTADQFSTMIKRVGIQHHAGEKLPLALARRRSA